MEMKLLIRSYYKILCVAAGRILRQKERQFKVSYRELAALTSMPTFVALHYGRVLSLFARLCLEQCVLTFSALALSAQAKGCWQGLLIRALRWLKASKSDFRNAPEPSMHTLDAWADSVRVMGGEFKVVCKIAVRESHKQVADEIDRPV
eukprot:5457238-Amphidinium_carterae.2